jgi:iron complex outermembrane receptor protein
MSYEAGFKSTLMGGLFAVNADVFYTKMKDFQTSAFNPATAQSSAQNVPYAETKGFEVDVFGRPLRELTINGGLIYNDATYGPFLVSCTPVVSPSCPATGIFNVDGQQLQATPKWKLTFAGEYAHDLSGGLQGFAAADVVYTSKINFNQFPDPAQEVGSRAIVGARAGVRSADRKWSAAIFARNLFDERTPVFLYSPYLLSGSTAPGIKAVGRSYSIDSFRLLGVSLDAKF